MMNNSCVKIGERLIGHGHPTYIIAEIGINHNGSMEIAKQLIDGAVKAGWMRLNFKNVRHTFAFLKSSGT